MSEEQDAPTARGIVLSLQNTLLESAVKGGGAAWVSHASLMMQVREGGGAAWVSHASLMMQLGSCSSSSSSTAITTTEF